MMHSNKILYIDMDNVLVDFKTGIERIDPELRLEYDGRLDEVPDIFSLMDPMPEAIESYELLSSRFDTYILSTSPWENHTAWSDKIQWVKKYLGKPAYKRLILTHNKHLNHGDYLVDDRPNNGAERFVGEWIRFGSERFPDWITVREYLMNNEQLIRQGGPLNAE